MKVQRLDGRTIVLQELNDFFCDLLRQIIPSAEPNHPAAKARFYSSPSGGTEREFDADWRRYVEPDLRAHFRDNLEIVAGDLRLLPENSSHESAKVPIPFDHLEAWINSLNQARLALASRHQITEQEMESEPALDTPRGYSLFQILFYGFLQECFLRELAQTKS